MKLISDIINELTDSDKSILSPLLKTKVLASRIKNGELLTWVNNELNGYDFQKEVPEYRKCSGNISGTYLNGSYQFNDQVLPISGLPDEIRDVYLMMDFHQSVAALESLKGRNKGTLEHVFSAEMVAILQNNIRKMGNPYFQILVAKKWIPINILDQILSVVRSKLLDFMLKLDDEFGGVTNLEEFQNSNKLITSIMNQTIVNNGDGNILNTGDSVKIEAKISINKGDKESLSNFLSKHHIDNADIEDLLKVVDIESPNSQKGTFGLQVNSWMNKMLGKALDGSWQVGIGTAGGMLADAIQSYYGIN